MPRNLLASMRLQVLAPLFLCARTVSCVSASPIERPSGRPAAPSHTSAAEIQHG